MTAPKTPAAKPRATASKPPAVKQPEPLPSYLTEWQVRELLKALEQWRIYENQGQVNVAQYDIRAHLNRIFGFGRWSGDVIAMELIFDRPWKLNSGAEAAYVAYRCGYRLTVCAMDGTTLATYTEWSVGDDKKSLTNHADAHAMAVKTAESQALKRAAINLGDQFGLSLYHKPNVNLAKREQPLQPLVGGTMLIPGQPWSKDQLLELDQTQVGEEVDPDHPEELPTRDVNQEPTPPQAPQNDPTPVAAQPPTPEAVRPQDQPAQPNQQQIYDGAQPVPVDMDIPALVHEFEETVMQQLSPEAKTALNVLWKRANMPYPRAITTTAQIDAAWMLYEQVKPAPMQQQPGDAATQQLRQQQQAAARRHFPEDVPADNYGPEPDYA